MNIPIGLQELRVFLTLADELHFGRAAARLGITPSRVSQTIRQLERRVGGRLLERSNHTTSLTSLGEHVRDVVSEPYAELLTVLTTLTTSREPSGSELRIGLLPQTAAAGPRWLDILAAFHAEQPSCRTSIIDLTLVDFLGPLMRGDVHVICTRLPLRHPRIAIGPVLADESRVLLVARHHRLSTERSVSMEVLGDYMLVQVPHLPEELLEDLLPSRTPAGRPIPKGPRIESMTEVLAAVAAGQVVHPTACSTPLYRAHPMVVSVPIVDAPPARSALAYLRADESSKTRSFVDIAARVLGVPRPGSAERQRSWHSHDEQN